MPEPDRLDALRQFAARALGRDDVAIERASADASFRSYWRVRAPGMPSAIAMDAPPGKEDVGPWLDVAQRLRRASVHAPAVLAEDRAQGFVLMGDLGARLYLPELDDASVDALYGDALEALFRMQTRADAEGLPRYDEARLMAEMALFPEWFVGRHLGVALECDEWERIESAFRLLTDSALEQPVAFVHRDYHSRNLLVTERDNPGVIDFQDAVLGPVTYDLASLLRDCYVEWQDQRVADWSEAHRRRLEAAGLVQADADQWRRWFDLMGLQRHIKVLGIFCRLCYRDGKHGYLGDLPLVLRYTLRVAARYPELAPFGDWLRARVGERDLTRTIEAVA